MAPEAAAAEAPVVESAPVAEGPRVGALRLGSTAEGQVQRASFLSSPTGQSFDDQYWASQPPAVQALRGIDDLEERQKLAGALMAAGYTIDVPIMVWGWGAENTSKLRQAYGYTWVPHAMQEAIKIAPGLSMPGVDAYDPDNPPPGAILVDSPGSTPSWFLGGPSGAEVESADGEKMTLPETLLTTGEQALAVKARLQELGLGELELGWQPPVGGFQVNWGTEPRRTWALGGVNVGLWMESLARGAAVEELRALLKKG